MTEGYIYVLSNKSLNRNLYKIGLTTKHPISRAKQLSQSTSIPSDFDIYYFKKTNNIQIAEKRIHLLLDEYRVNKNKEFFQLKKSIIKKTINKIIDEVEYEYNQSDNIHIHKDLIYSNYIPKLTLNGHKILNSLMIHTTQNTVVNQLIGFNEDITNGFLSSIYLSTALKISHQQSLNIMREFVKKFDNLEVNFHKTGIKLKVFKDLRYARGEMSWVFNDEFRKYFYNEYY